MSKPLPRTPVACLIVAAWFLLGSCDKGPTQPDTVPPPVPPPPVQRSTGPIAFVSDRDGTDAIYLANEDGSAITRLTEGWGPAWSRDGRKIAFERAHSIYVINVDGSGLQFVTQGYHPSWSRDGGLVALDDLDSIYTVDANGSTRRKLFDSDGYGAFDPVWSPDGQRIVFHVGTFVDLFLSPPLGIWVMDKDGSSLQHLHEVHDGWKPAWSPDGSQLAFLIHSGIGVVGVDGSGRRLVVAGAIEDVDWTANGRLIFIKAIAGNPFDGPARIFINDGTERQLIPDATAPTRLEYRDSQVAWLR